MGQATGKGIIQDTSILEQMEADILQHKEKIFNLE